MININTMKKRSKPVENEKAVDRHKDSYQMRIPLNLAFGLHLLADRYANKPTVLALDAIRDLLEKQGVIPFTPEILSEFAEWKRKRAGEG